MQTCSKVIIDNKWHNIETNVNDKRVKHWLLFEKLREKEEVIGEEGEEDYSKNTSIYFETSRLETNQNQNRPINAVQ